MPIGNKIKVRWKQKIPKITIASPAVSGTVGDLIQTSFTISTPNGVDSVYLDGPDADSFVVTSDGHVQLIDSSTAGTYTCYLNAADDNGRLAIPVKITFTVNAAAGLPTLTLSTSALDAHTIQCTFTSNVAYSSYQYAVNTDTGKPLNLAVNKQIPIVESGQDYDIQVRGKTAGGAFGPWSTASRVTLPYATLELLAVAIDADTIEMQFTDDATYVSYQAQVKIGAGSYGSPINLDSTKRVNSLLASTTYTCQVRGLTP